MIVQHLRRWADPMAPASSMSAAVARRRLAADQRVVAVLDGEDGGEVHVDLRSRSRAVEVRHLDRAGRLVRLVYLSEEGGPRLSVRQTLHRRFGGEAGSLIHGSVGVVMPDKMGLGWLLDVRRAVLSSRRGRVESPLPATLRFPEDADPEALGVLAALDVEVAALPDEAPFVRPPGPVEVAERVPGHEIPPLPPTSTVPPPVALAFPWLWFFGADEDLTDRIIEAFPDEAAAVSILLALVEPELWSWAASKPADARAQAAMTAVQRLLLS